MKSLEQCLLLNVGVVARGSRCLSIMRTLQSIRPSRMRLRLVGLATVTRSIACNKYAGEEGIELFENHRDLLTMEYLDLVLELTGNEEILGRQCYEVLHGASSPCMEPERTCPPSLLMPGGTALRSNSA